MNRFVIFNDENPATTGGFCVSAFVIAKRNNGVLVGKIAQPEVWAEKWYLPLNYPHVWKGLWQLPATYLMLGEHPDVAAQRVMREQLTVTEYKLGTPKIFASTMESKRRPGNIHNDIFFVYDAEIGQSIPQLPWFSEIHYADPQKVANMTFGRAHKDVLEAVGFV
ncbi:MAG: hypothetical protein ACE5PO_06605 [Candidatus Bathyarchaeia archaeon]